MYANQKLKSIGSIVGVPRQNIIRINPMERQVAHESKQNKKAL